MPAPTFDGFARHRNSPRRFLRWLRRAGAGIVLAGLSGVFASCGDSGITDVPDESAIIDPCDAIEPIALGQAGTGTLTSSDCRVSGRYRDRWELDLESAATIMVELESDQFDAFLELRTSGGSLIAMNDDARGFDSRIIESLEIGTYVIVATTYGEGMSGQYRVSVTEAPDCSAVGTVGLGETVSGTLEEGDCTFELADRSDNWSLTLERDTVVRIGLRSPDFEESVGIRDAGGDILYGAVAYDLDEGAWFDLELSAGSYTVIATTFEEGAGGSYELTVDAAPPCTPGSALVLGESVQGELTGEDCRSVGYVGGAPADSWSLVLETETTVDVHLKSLDFEPMVLVRDTSGSVIGQGYPGEAPGMASILRLSLEPGSYRVNPTSWDEAARGAYELTVEEFQCPEPSPIAIGESVSGTLSREDCTRPGGQYRDRWSLSLAEEREIRIDLVSESFDAHLSVRDGDGALVAEDDDGGSGLDARIGVVLSAGSYVISASSFAPGEVGPYELTVDVPTAAAAGATATERTRIKAASTDSVKETSSISAPGNSPLVGETAVESRASGEHRWELPKGTKLPRR